MIKIKAALIINTVVQQTQNKSKKYRRKRPCDK